MEAELQWLNSFQNDITKCSFSLHSWFTLLPPSPPSITSFLPHRDDCEVWAGNTKSCNAAEKKHSSNVFITHCWGGWQLRGKRRGGMMEGGEEEHEQIRGCGTGKRKWEGARKKRWVRNEGRQVESFHNLRIHRLTWWSVSMHSESADGEYNLKAACEAERDLLQKEREC